MKRLFILLFPMLLQAQSGNVMNLFPDNAVLNYAPGSVLNVFGNYIPIPLGDLSFIWMGAINPADSCPINHLTGQSTSDIKFINFIGNINDGYVSAKSPTLLKVFDDTIPVCVLFPDYNYADTTFFGFENYTLDGNSCELLPRRLTSIAMYNVVQTGSALTTLYSLYNVPDKGSFNHVIPDDHATFAEADAAISAGDTIYIKSGTLTESCVLHDQATIIGIGDVVLNGGATYALHIYSSDPVIVSGVELKSTNITLRFNGAAAANHEAHNIYISDPSTYPVYSILAGDINYTITDSYIKGAIEIRNNLTITDSYIIPENGANCLRTGIVSGKTYNINRCFVPKNGNGSLVRISSLQTTINSRDNDYYIWNLFDELGAAADVPYIFNFTKDSIFGSHVYMSTGTADCNISIDSCYLKHNDPDAWFMVRLKNQNSVSITNSYFTDMLHSVYVYADDTATNFTFDKNIYYSNTSVGTGVYAANVNATITDNYFEGDAGATISIFAATLDVLHPVFSRNEIHHKSGTAPSLWLENLPDVPTYYLDSAVISDNIFYGPRYYGGVFEGHHGVFLTSTREMDISGNKFIGYDFANVLKAKGHSARGTKFSLNQYIECGTGLIIRGASNVEVFGNVFVSDTIVATQNISLATHESVIPSYADTILVHNNIFHCDGYNNMIVDDLLNLTHSEFDNNIYYGVTNIVSVESTDYDFATWQSTFSQDASSFNADPQFTSLENYWLWPVTGSDANGNGVDLGAGYNSVLLNTSTWPDGVTTDTQDASWDIGAFKIE